MSVQITSEAYYGQPAVVTLYSSTGNTIPYTSANTISLGVQTIPFSYSSATISDEYGVFSCDFTGFSKTCTINQQTPQDGDGNRYDTIKIGNQIWMSENLKTTKFQDGTLLSNTSQVDNATWSAATESDKYWALVSGSTGTTLTYGLVYNQFAVTGSTSGSTASTNLCPVGYHIPTLEEFQTLRDYFDPDPEQPATAGVQMKSTTLWTVSEGSEGTNLSGFNGVPAGFRNINGSWSAIFESGERAFFWTTTPYTEGQLTFDSTGFQTNNNGTALYGFSVRCLKD